MDAVGEKYEEFIESCKSKILRAESAVNNAKQLKIELTELDDFIKKYWTDIFSNLNETPFSNSQQDQIKSILTKIIELQDKTETRSNWFHGITDFMKNSLKK